MSTHRQRGVDGKAHGTAVNLRSVLGVDANAANKRKCAVGRDRIVVSKGRPVALRLEATGVEHEIPWRFVEHGLI